MTQEPLHTKTNEPIRSLEACGFVLTERAHSPNWVIPSHAHGTTVVGIVYKGFYTERIGARSQVCPPHSLQLLPAGESHSYKFGEASVGCLTIDIKPHKREEIGKFSAVLDTPVHVRGARLSALLTRLYREFRLKDSTSVLTVEGLILEVLGTAARQNGRCALSAQPLWLRQARDFIHENATEGVSLISVAASAGVHPAYLARAFRKFYGCTVGDYVRRLRLDYAVRELKESRKSIAEVAAAAGFYDQSHMTHAFKLQLNITPAEYRSAFGSSQGDTKKR